MSGNSIHREAMMTSKTTKIPEYITQFSKELLLEERGIVSKEMI
jgi:hypothetical protein